MNWLRSLVVVFDQSNNARSPFIEGSENFSHPESHGKISNLLITELFYSRVLNMNKGFLHTIMQFEVSGVHTSPFLDIDELIMVLRARKVSRDFAKQAPGSIAIF